MHRSGGTKECKSLGEEYIVKPSQAEVRGNPPPTLQWRIQEQHIGPKMTGLRPWFPESARGPD
jgi:hypothetical protein